MTIIDLKIYTIIEVVYDVLFLPCSPMFSHVLPCSRIEHTLLQVVPSNYTCIYTNKDNNIMHVIIVSIM